jgi:hypothetical protein
MTHEVTTNDPLVNTSHIARIRGVAEAPRSASPTRSTCAFCARTSVRGFGAESFRRQAAVRALHRAARAEARTVADYANEGSRRSGLGADHPIPYSDDEP